MNMTSTKETRPVRTAKESLTALLERKGYTTGKMWHGKESVAAVMPILLTEPPTWERAYVLAEEVADKLDLRDTGSINIAAIKNNAGKPVSYKEWELSLEPWKLELSSKRDRWKPLFDVSAQELLSLQELDTQSKQARLLHYMSTKL